MNYFLVILNLTQTTTGKGAAIYRVDEMENCDDEREINEDSGMIISTKKENGINPCVIYRGAEEQFSNSFLGRMFTFLKTCNKITTSLSVQNLDP